MDEHGALLPRGYVDTTILYNLLDPEQQAETSGALAGRSVCLCKTVIGEWKYGATRSLLRMRWKTERLCWEGAKLNNLVRVLGPGQKRDRTRGQLIIAALEDRPDFQSEAGQDWALEAIDSAIEEWEYHYASGEGWELVSGGTDCARADVPSSLDVLDFTARPREACANCNVYTAIEENAASFGAMADRLLHPPKPLSQWMPSARRKAAGGPGRSTS